MGFQTFRNIRHLNTLKQISCATFWVQSDSNLIQKDTSKLWHITVDHKTCHLHQICHKCLSTAIFECLNECKISLLSVCSSHKAIVWLGYIYGAFTVFKSENSILRKSKWQFFFVFMILVLSLIFHSVWHTINTNSQHKRNDPYGTDGD